jgi:hypothetical protein
MGFFDKLLGMRQERAARRILQTARREVAQTYGPLHAVGMGIVSTAHSAYLRLGAVFGYSESAKPSDPQMLLFCELLYFFSHLTIRTAAARRLSDTQIGKIQRFLGPFLASTVVDSFFNHWPEELKNKIRVSSSIN